MLETGRYLYVGFMCHQVIEKMLKGHFVQLKGETPPYTHNLLLLAKETNLAEQFSQVQKEFIRELRPLNIESRYPPIKEKIGKTLKEKQCQQIYSKTKELSEWLKKKLNE